MLANQNVPSQTSLTVGPSQNDHQLWRAFLVAVLAASFPRCLSKNLFTTSRKRPRPRFRMTVLEFFIVFNLFYKQPPGTMVWSLGSLYVLRYLQYEKNLSIHVVQKQHQWNYIFCNLKIASDTFSPKRCFRTSPLETLLLLNEYWASHKRPLTLRVLGVERKWEITFTDVVQNYYLFST